MASYSVSGSLRIAAPPARIYGIIADYRRGHPTILPKQFRNLRVESGSGIGAGTTIRFEVTVMGKTDRYKAIVSEPEPGRVLVEKNVEPNDWVSTFTVNPVDDGRAANVTIRTDLTVRSGLLGAIEKFVMKRVMASMYAKELQLLAARAATGG
ncbi:MAG TPA: SRPBCC family protein [Vicinamibacterales bacterium]|nr:SRPBCC family protein [Vicinamibacterales bacterium]